MFLDKTKWLFSEMVENPQLQYLHDINVLQSCISSCQAQNDVIMYDKPGDSVRVECNCKEIDRLQFQLEKTKKLLKTLDK